MEEQDGKVGHRRLPHSKKRKLRHDEALHFIMRDCTGPSPIFGGKEFDTIFRISMRQFEKIAQDIAGDEFFQVKTDCFNNQPASIEAQILMMALKCLLQAQCGSTPFWSL